MGHREGELAPLTGRTALNGTGRLDGMTDEACGEGEAWKRGRAGDRKHDR